MAERIHAGRPCLTIPTSAYVLPRAPGVEIGPATTKLSTSGLGNETPTSLLVLSPSEAHTKA